MSCAWHEDDDGLWQMACGGDPWLFESGGVVENRVKFCMNCGKPVAIEKRSGPATPPAQMTKNSRRKPPGQMKQRRSER